MHLSCISLFAVGMCVGSKTVREEDCYVLLSVWSLVGVGRGFGDACCLTEGGTPLVGIVDHVL